MFRWLTMYFNCISLLILMGFSESLGHELTQSVKKVLNLHVK